MNPYIFFSMLERKKVIKEQPELKSEIGSVAKIIGERWSRLSDAEKSKYKKEASKIAPKKKSKAKTAKAKAKAKAEAESDLSEGMGKKVKTRKTRKTRKLSGYMKFYKKNYSTISSKLKGASMPEVAKEMGRQWSSLSAAEKAKY